MKKQKPNTRIILMLSAIFMILTIFILAENHPNLMRQMKDAELRLLRQTIELAKTTALEAAPEKQQMDIADQKLVQLWFKEIDGKVLIFRIYHITDFNYMLNVMIVEGDKITQIRNDLLAPDKSRFVLTEGEIFSSRG